VFRFLRYLLEPQVRLAEEKDVHIHQDLPQSAFMMDFDPERLESVISNLVSNAIRHTPSGSDISIRVRTGKGISPQDRRFYSLFPERSFGPDQELLLVSVRDEGQGIARQEIPKIFGRFYQSPKSGPPSYGTGIGLALVRDLLDLMEGQLLVDSKPGEGSEFCMILPVTREAEQRNRNEGVRDDKFPLPECRDVDPNGQKRELLIIEDNRDIAEYISFVLADAYAVRMAKNGAEGIELARAYLPDLIISDIMMPEKDGYEVCEVLKNDVRTSHIAVILLTARADRESRIRGLESGADAFLVKPFDHRELQVRLQKLWQLREALQQKYRIMTLSHIDQQLPENQDTIFLSEIKSLMEAHLDDEGFDVQQMAEE